MAEVIKMPKMSDTMTEGVISTWLKKEGDTIKVSLNKDKSALEMKITKPKTKVKKSTKKEQ